MEDTASLFRNTSKVQPSPDSLYRVYGKPKVKTGNGQLVPNGKVGPAPRGRALSPKPTSCKKDDSGSHPGEINTSDQSDIILQLERDQRVNDDSSGSGGSDADMPTNQSHPGSARSRSARSWRRNQSDLGDDSKDNTRRDRNVRSSDRRVRKPLKATEIVDTSKSHNEEHKQDTNDPEEKALQFLAVNIRDYSRQRLRAVHMSLRHYSNVELRVSQKDLGQAFQENHVKLSNRVIRQLLDRFEDQQGVDFEKLYRYLTDAHTRSGRDSVLAMQCRNDMIPRPEMTQEEKDRDLLARLEDLLVRNNTFFDLADLREAFQYKDRNKSGRVEKSEMFDICCRRNAPVYGALLKALVKRCDGDNNGMVSWPEFLSFLEKAQGITWKKYPAMADLPEQARKAQIQADPFVELSEETKSKLIGKLLSKKSSLSKVRGTKKKEESPANGESKQNSKAPDKKEESTPSDKTTQKQVKVATENVVTPKHVRILDQPQMIEDNQCVPNGNVIKEEPGKVDSKPEVAEHSQSDNSDKAVAQPESEEPKSQKLVQNMRKVKGLVKTSSGFIHSVKSFISGKKKSDPEASLASSEPQKKATENRLPQVTLDNNETQKEKAKPPKDTIAEDGDMLCIKSGNQTIKFPKPDTYDKEETTLDPPQERLTLDWVYGYRGNDCRTNIHVLGNEEVVYFVSKIAVLYDRTSHKQRHYREHTEDLKCVAVHSNLSMIASGQFAGKDNISAHIRVWRVDNLQTLFVLGEGMFQKAVMSLTFANGQDVLAAVDNSPDKTLTIWDLSTGTLIGQTTINVDVICDIQFNPKYPDVLVSTGKEHIAWWKVYRDIGTIQSVAQPDYETYLRAKFIICLTHNDRGDLITGDSNGTVYIWGDGGNKITNFIKHAHDGPVFTLLYSKGLLLSGGRDGMMYCWLWNKNMDQSGSLQIPRSEGGVRMIQIHNESLLVGTTMNSMLSAFFTPSKQSSPVLDATLDPIPITQGHFDDLRGIACVRRSEVGGDFVTAGLDGIICWFDSARRDPVCKLVLKGQQFLCIDSSPSGKLIAMGTKDGRVVLIQIEGENSSDVFNTKICKDRIDTIHFSPDYLHIAAGCHDSGIYVISVQHKDDGSVPWEFIGKFNGHKGPVNSLDFSCEKKDDSYIVKSCSSKPDVACWRLNDQSLIGDVDLSSVEWASHHCKLDRDVVGLWWSKQAQDGEVNCIDVNDTGNVVAMGDKEGYLSIFRYPCTRKGVFCHTYKSHTSIQKVLFVYQKIFVITIGGNDSCILQWRIV